MDIRFEPITPNADIHALAVWDDTWNSYNNCYLIVRDSEVMLIDTGRATHLQPLVDALASLDKTPDDVTTLIATHGHKDHIGNSLAFRNAHKLIHPDDVALLDDDLKTIYSPTLPNDGDVVGLQCVLLGHHTSGSVALFDEVSGVLFAADHLCYFGDDLPEDKLVSHNAELRERSYRFIQNFAHDRKVRVKFKFDLFTTGLQKLTKRFNHAQAFCTGHGGVLQGDIGAFLEQACFVAEHA
jgi:glyoxylase-like metal-dependent hydrolase (beta-lactamase superfamily II)